MAVHPAVRGRLQARAGAGLRARARGAALVWCTARETAYRFYEKLGFTADDATITMPGRTDTAFHVMRRYIDRQSTVG